MSFELALALGPSLECFENLDLLRGKPGEQIPLRVQSSPRGRREPGSLRWLDSQYLRSDSPGGRCLHISQFVQGALDADVCVAGLRDQLLACLTSSREVPAIRQAMESFGQGLLKLRAEFVYRPVAPDPLHVGVKTIPGRLQIVHLAPKSRKFLRAADQLGRELGVFAGDALPGVLGKSRA